MKRLSALDWAKTIGILLICTTHFLEKQTIARNLIDAFVVPFFFVITGFLTNKKTASHAAPAPLPMRSFLLKSARRTLVPYAFWFILSAPFAILFDHTSPLECLSCFFYIRGEMIWNIALWFLPCYFIVTAAFHALTLLFRKHMNIVSVVSMAVGFLITILLDQAGIRDMFFGLNKCAFLLGMMCVGYLLKNLYLNSGTRPAPLLYLFLFLLGCGLTVLLDRGVYLSVEQCEYGNIFIYIPLSALLSCSLLLGLFLLPSMPAVTTLAGNTLFIMGTHLFGRSVLRFIVAQNSILYRSAGIWIFLLESVFILLLNRYTKKHEDPGILRWDWVAGLSLSRRPAAKEHDSASLHQSA